MLFTCNGQLRLSCRPCSLAYPSAVTSQEEDLASGLAGTESLRGPLKGTHLQLASAEQISGGGVRDDGYPLAHVA